VARSLAILPALDRLTPPQKGVVIEGAHPDQKCRIDETHFDDAMEHFRDGTGATVVGRRVRGSAAGLTVVALQPTTAPTPDE
jgi:hypothetical protein